MADCKLVKRTSAWKIWIWIMLMKIQSDLVRRIVHRSIPSMLYIVRKSSVWKPRISVKDYIEGWKTCGLFSEYEKSEFSRGTKERWTIEIRIWTSKLIARSPSILVSNYEKIAHQKQWYWMRSMSGDRLDLLTWKFEEKTNKGTNSSVRHEPTLQHVKNAPKMGYFQHATKGGFVKI